MEEELKNFLAQTAKLNEAIDSRPNGDELSEKQKKELAELKKLINKAKTDVTNAGSVKEPNLTPESNK